MNATPPAVEFRAVSKRYGPVTAEDVKFSFERIADPAVGSPWQYAFDALDRVEVIDARSLVPFDYAPVIESVRKTGRILLASDACERGSVLQTMAAKITQFAFNYLDAPPARVCQEDVPLPYAANLETLSLPSVEKIVRAAKAVCYK